MVQQGYFENRIKELEKREFEVMEEYTSAKFRLQAIKKEKDKAFEFMNSAHYQPNNNQSELETEIASLNSEINSLKNTIKKMNNTINKKNGQIKSLNKVIEDKDHIISKSKLEHHLEQSKLEDKIAKINIAKNKEIESSRKEILNENRQLTKENRSYKKDIRALNERIEMMDESLQRKIDIISQKNHEIDILHERLGWQPKKNIFDELREEKAKENE